LFRDREEPARADVLIQKHHYFRRFGELTDAVDAAQDW